MPRYGIPETVADNLPAFLAGWGLDVLNFQEIEEGFDNLNVLITTDSGKVVLRWYSFRDSSDIPFELETIARCREVGFPVAGVLPSRSGNLFEELAGKPAALFEFIEGEHPKIRSTDRSQIGKWLGEYHGALAEFRPNHAKAYGELSELECADHEEGRMLKLGYADFIEDLHTLRTEYVPSLQEAWPRLPHGVIHGDFYPGNLLIDSDKLVALLDFDTSFWGSLLRDIADAVLCWSLHDSRFLPDEAARQETVEGYERVRRLTAQELEIMPHTLLLACFSDAVRYLVGWIEAGDPPAVARDCHMYCRYKELEREFLRDRLI